LIVILLFIIIRQKYKQKEAKLIQGQQRANEETYQLMLNQQALQEEAKTIEKKRIALELHDNILNKLASIRFNLYSLSQKNDAKTIQNALTHVDKIKGVEDEIRTITHDFSNDIFAATYSFKIILEQLIAEQNKLYPKTKYHLELEEGINWDTISSKIKMNLYRIIQEALYNIHKHAKATKAVVALIQDENNICMSIQDNGIGFDVSKIKEGIGIKNIKLRISQLSGKITINSSTKYGTAINVAVPIVTISQ
ncbi:MAG: two-component sensor histidine kinase, partial [Flavobacterium sp.]|nr:two-component sensor histidine kinase [Flavobacterium sp.]